MAAGSMDGQTRRVSRSASIHPSASTTAGAISISDGSSTGSPFSRTALDLTPELDGDQAASSSQLAIRRGASSGSQNGPHLVPGRGNTQGGVEPTGRSRSLGGHRGVRTTRHVRGWSRLKRFRTLRREASSILKEGQRPCASGSTRRRIAWPAIARRWQPPLA